MENDKTTFQPDRFEDAPAMRLVGLKETYTFDRIKEIPQLWNRFEPYLTKEGGTTYGVSLTNGTENGFDYLAAVEEGYGLAPSGELVAVEFPAQRYAIFPHTESLATLSKTIDRIMGEWIPNSGLEMTADPILFERYGPGFDPEAMSGDLELWVPMKRKNA
ncbi:AraC family transcriptional regulator [bacterium]|nr:MAG: AraC family transcriptional regulator [bacterium]